MTPISPAPSLWGITRANAILRVVPMRFFTSEGFTPEVASFTRTSPGPATLRHHNAVLECLRKNGFSVAAAAHAYSLLDSYVYGFVLQQLNLPFNTFEEAGPAADSIMAEVAAGEYPYLVEMAVEHVLKPGYNYAKEFGIGLEIVLDGLERLRGEE